MRTEVVDRSREGVSVNDRDERAQTAVKVFRSMQFGLSNYARAITGNPKVRVEIDGGVPRTDGTTIYYRPPIELGDRTPHERYNCDKRNEVGLHICPACRVREEVLVNIYHEIAHIAFDTFAATSESDRNAAIKEAVREWGGEYAKRIEDLIRNAPQKVAGNFLGLAGLISPFLPHLFNSLEDARVDSAMFRARKGTRKMLEADTLNLLRMGVPDANGELHMLNEAPLNTQISLACYLYVTGYRGWRDMLHSKVVADLDDPQLLSYLDEIKTAESASEVYALTFPILARLRELGYLLQPEEEPQDEPNPEPEPEESGDPSDDAGKSDVPADDTAEPEGDPSASEGDDGSGDGGADDPSGDADGADSPREGDSSEGDESSDEEAPEPPVDSEDGAGDEAGPSDDADGAGEEEGSSGEGAEGGGADGGSDGDGSSGGGSRDGEPEGHGGPPEAGGDAGSSGGVQDDSEEGVADGSDSDSVPEDADRDADAGQAGDSADAGSGDAPEQPSGGPDRESDSTPSDGGDGGGEEPDGDTPGPKESAGSGDQGGLDSADGGSRDADGGERDREGRPELDSDRGNSGVDEGSVDADGHGGDGSDPQATGDDSPKASTDHHTGESQDDTEGSRGGDDEGRAGESASQDGGPDEVLESGADQGLGGIEIALPEKGSHEDVAAALSHGHKERDENVKETKADEKAILVAIIQGAYFETPSLGVNSVTEHTYSPHGMAWDTSMLGGDERMLNFFGVQCDMDIPESVLGPALLKTRRIFSDNKTAAHEKNLRSGRINQRSLGKRAWSGDDRLFAKKRIPAKKDYAVLIGMDISSSNRGDNLALLKRSVMAQAELCSRVGVEFSIIAHSCTVEVDEERNRRFGLHLHHIKDWNQPWDSSAQKALADLNAVGGNLDGHALEFMRKSMAAVSATDKIILYYTDGKMPAANKDEELEVLVRQIKNCKRDNITLLGVGMQTDSPERHGLDTVQVDSDEDLGSVVEHLGKRLGRSAR